MIRRSTIPTLTKTPNLMNVADVPPIPCRTKLHMTALAKRDIRQKEAIVVRGLT